MLEHDEAIDDIIDHICTVPQAPAQHTEQQHSEAQAQQLSTAQAEQHSIPPAQQPKTTAQATVTASSIPSISRNHNASTADSITQQEPTMPTYYTDVHDAMIHTHLPEILDSEAE